MRILHPSHLTWRVSVPWWSGGWVRLCVLRQHERWVRIPSLLWCLAENSGPTIYPEAMSTPDSRLHMYSLCTCPVGSGSDVHDSRALTSDHLFRCRLQLWKVEDTKHNQNTIINKKKITINMMMETEVMRKGCKGMKSWGDEETHRRVAICFWEVIATN